MSRVTVSQSQQDLGRPKGLRIFSFEPGKMYHVLFLGEELNGKQEPIMYMNYTHNVRKDGKGFEVRCASEHYNFNSVIATDEEGNLLIDPKSASKRPLNDGTCPYCETRELNSKYVFAKREEWILNNPGATDKDIKEMTRKLFENEPVSDPAKRRIMLVAIFELDDKNKIQTDSEGNKLYTIQGMRFSDSQFNTKLLEQAEIKRMGLEDENDDGLAWHEYYFKYPKTENKMLSGKDMTIAAVPNEVVHNDAALRARLEEDIKNLDLDELGDAMYIFRLKSLEEMERDVSALKSRITENMSDTDIEEALEEMGGDEVISDDDINEIMGKTTVAETLNKDVAKGEASFDVGVSDEDINNLM